MSFSPSLRTVKRWDMCITPRFFYHFLLAMWVRLWMPLTVASKKFQGVLCKLCVPNLTRALSPLPIYLSGKQIYPSSVVKDLEVWIDSNLTCDEHISKLSSICLYKLRLTLLNTCSIERHWSYLAINAFVFTRIFFIVQQCGVKPLRETLVNCSSFKTFPVGFF